PTIPGSQQQLGIAGQQFQDLDEIDIDRQSNRAVRVFEEPLQIRLRECPLAKLRQGFLLLDPAAQLNFEIGALGYVVAQTDDASGGTALDENGAARCQPALAGIRGVGNAISGAKAALLLRGFLESSIDR